MRTTIVMPQLGESVAEGIIGKWLKREGEPIDKDEPIVEVITDKVNAEIPSPVAGVLQRITQAEGATVAVGQEIGIISDRDEESGLSDDTKSTGNGHQGSDHPVGASSPSAHLRTDLGTSTVPTGDRGERVRSSPLVRRLAEQYGVNLALVAGTGVGGRVSKHDILSYVEQAGRPGATAVAERVHFEAGVGFEREPQDTARTMDTPPAQTRPAQPPAPAAPLAVSVGDSESDEHIPVSPLRKIIAERMTQSKFTIPHATTMVEVDMTRVVRYRDARKDEFRAREGVSLSYVAIVIKATVEALKEHPMVNAEWAGDTIVIKRRININVAVDAPDGLTTPVIHGADGRSVAGLSRILDDLAVRARRKKLTLADMQGGTFTVNNTGALGSVSGVSIINYPQGGILATGTIVKRPVVLEQDGQDIIAVRSMMNLSFSFDHRLLDGGYASSFVNAVKGKLEAWPAEYPLY